MPFEAYPDPEPTFSGIPGGFFGQSAANFGIAYGQRQGWLDPGQPLFMQDMNAYDAFRQQKFYNDYNAVLQSQQPMQAAIFSEIISGGMYSAGLSISPDMQQGIDHLSNMVTPLAASMFMTTDGGRRTLDQLSGGRSAYTIAGGLGNSAGQMYDAVTGKQGLGRSSTIAHANALVADVMGFDQNLADPTQVYRDPYGGLSGTQIGSFTAQLAARGMLPSGTALEEALNNKSYRDLVYAGGANPDDDMAKTLLALRDSPDRPITSGRDLEQFQEEQRLKVSEIYARSAQNSAVIRDQATESRNALMQGISPSVDDNNAGVTREDKIARILESAELLNGNLAMSNPAQATELKEALDAIRSEGIAGFSKTSLGKDVMATGDSGVDRLTALVAAGSEGAISASDLNDLVNSRTVQSIRSVAADETRADAFGIKTAEVQALELEGIGGETGEIIREDQARSFQDKVRDRMKSLSAVTDLLKSQGLQEAEAEAYALVTQDQLLNNSTHQMTGAQSERYIRQMTAATGSLGMGMEQIQAMSTFAAGMANQAGLQTAYAPNIAMAGLVTSQAMRALDINAASIYGGMSVEQFAMQDQANTANFVSSQQGAELGALIGIVDRLGVADTAEGRQFKEMVEQADKLGITTPELKKFMESSRSEQMDIIAAATGSNRALAGEMLDNQFMSEQYLARSAGADRARRQLQSDEMRDDTNREGMAGVASALGRGASSEVIDIVSGSITESAFARGAGTVMAEDPATFRETAGRDALARLKAAGQQDYINSLGGDAAAIRTLGQAVVGYRGSVEQGTGGPLENRVNAYGESALVQKDIQEAGNEVKAVIAQLVSGDTTAGLAGLTKSLAEAGKKGEGMTLAEMIGVFSGVDLSGASKDRLNELGGQMQTLEEEYADKRAAVEATGVGPEQARKLKALEREYETQGAKLLEMLEGNIQANTPEMVEVRKSLANDAAATKAAAGGGGGTGIRNIEISGATINLYGNNTVTTMSDTSGSIPVSDGTVNDAATN